MNINENETINDFEEALDTWDMVADANDLVWIRDENECPRFWMFADSWGRANHNVQPASPFTNAYI